MAEYNPFRKARYQLSAHHLRQLPPDAGFEVAIAGRSNAGKSSAINRLTGQNSLARTSKTPGRTQQIVMFELDISRRIADLPGYGYARVPPKLKQHWQAVMSTYLQSRRCLKGMVLVMDIRHPLKPFDQQMINWGVSSDLPCHVLLSKSDKLKRGPGQSTLLSVRKAMPDGGPTSQCTAQTFSAKTGEGLEQWLRVLKTWFDYPPDKPKTVQ